MEYLQYSPAPLLRKEKESLLTFKWKTGILLNSRKNCFIEVSFNNLVSATAVDKKKVEVLELLTSIVGDYASKILSEFRL